MKARMSRAINARYSSEAVPSQFSFHQCENQSLSSLVIELLASLATKAMTGRISQQAVLADMDSIRHCGAAGGVNYGDGNVEAQNILMET
jgi:hypothetical protein